MRHHNAVNRRQGGGMGLGPRHSRARARPPCHPPGPALLQDAAPPAGPPAWDRRARGGRRPVAKTN